MSYSGGVGHSHCPVSQILPALLCMVAWFPLSLYSRLLSLASSGFWPMREERGWGKGSLASSPTPHSDEAETGFLGALIFLP